MTDFLKQNFPILLLAFFNFVFVGVVLFVFIKLGGNKDAINWGTTSFAGFMGALLGLLTGKAVSQSRPTPEFTPTSTALNPPPKEPAK